jgi:hypothetical protein
MQIKIIVAPQSIMHFLWSQIRQAAQQFWAPWLSQNLFIAYILAVGSSNPSLVHSLIAWQLSPYVRTNQNHKQTYEFLIQAALLWLVHSNTKNQDYHRNTCIHIKISPCLGLLTMDQTYKNNLTYICIHLFLTLNTNKDIIVKYQKRRKHCRNQDHTTQHQCTEKVFVHSLNYWRGSSFEGDR